MSAENDLPQPPFSLDEIVYVIDEAFALPELQHKSIDEIIHAIALKLEARERVEILRGMYYGHG